MGNIVGKNIEEWAKDQVNVRQHLLGKFNRDTETLNWLTSNKPWIRAASCVYLVEGQKRLKPEALSEMDAVQQEAYLNSLNSGSLNLDAEDEDKIYYINKSTELTGVSNYRGRKLAEEYVLFNGTSAIDTETIQSDASEGDTGSQTYRFSARQRSGISEYDRIVNNNAYGLGGTERGLLPMPGILDLNITTYNRGSLRKAELKLKAFNREQFAIIDSLYMRPGYTILIEWGHSVYFKGKTGKTPQYTTANFNTRAFTQLMSPKSDSPDNSLPNQDSLLKAIRLEREDTQGNYDGFYGKITNFSWTLASDGSYDITVFAVSIGDVIESLSIDFVKAGYEEPQEPEDTDTSGNDDDESAWFVFDLEDSSTTPARSYSRKVRKGTEKRYREYWRDEEGYETNDKGLFLNVSPEFEEFKKNYPSTMDTYTLTRLPDYYGEEESEPQILITQKDKTKFNHFLYGAHASITAKTNTEGKSVPTQSYNPNNRTVKCYRDDIQLGIESKATVPIMDGGNGEETGRTATIISKNHPFQYIKLGFLLKYMQDNLMIVDGKGDSYIKFDYSFNTTGEDGNYCYTFPEQMSADPNVCVKSFKSRSAKNPEKFGNQWWFDVAGDDFQNKDSDFVGNLMHLWVNINYIASTLNNTLQRNQIPLLPFLENLMNGIGEALGGVNKFSVTYDHDENLIIIRDNLPLDPAVTGTNTIKEDRTLFNVNGVKTLDNGQGVGSFVHNVSISTTLSNKFATMIAIGAQAQSTSDVTNATAFSRWNDGLIDFVTPQKLSRALSKQTAEERNKKPLDWVKDSMESLYKAGQVIAVFYQGTAAPTSEAISSTSSLNSAVAGYLGTYYNKDFNVPSVQGFIPFDMGLTMDGFSGMRIYEKFYISTEILPPSYPDVLQFIIKGLRHSINASGWTTSIESMAMQSTDSGPALKFAKFEFSDEAPPNVPDAPGGENIVGENGRHTPDQLESIGISSHKLLKGGPAADFKRMYEAAKADGITIVVSDSYRTFSVQNSIFDWDLYVQTGGSKSDTKANRAAKRKKKGTNGSVAAAFPGTSNHGWGKAVDISPKEAQDWVKKNGHRYNWSWYEGKDVNENWHYTWTTDPSKLKDWLA